MRPIVYLGPLVLLAACIAAERWLFSPRPRASRPRRWVVLAACFLAPLAVYLYCLAPGLAGDDTAEYALQSYRLGLAHAGGYPFYLILGKLFSLPFGSNVVLGLNVMSALFSAGAVALLSAIVLRSGCGERLALYVPLQFAFVPAFWSQAVIAEVQNVSVAVGLALVLALLVWREGGCKPWGGEAVSLLAGLATGVYFPLLALVPALLVYILVAPEEPWKRRLRRAVRCAGASALAGALVLALVVVKARAEPPLGSLYPPVNLHNLYHALVGTEYGVALTGLGAIVRSWGRLARHYGSSFLVVSFLAGLVGIVAGARRRSPPLWLLLLIVLAGNGLYLYAVRLPQHPIMTNLSYAAFAVLAACGYSWLFARGWRWTAGVARILPLLPAAALLLFHAGHLRHMPREARAVDRSGEHEFDDFADRVLTSVPPHSIVFVAWPYATAIRYKQTVREQRPDVAAYEVRDGMWYGDLCIGSWREYVRHTHPERPVFLGVRDPAVLEFAELRPAGGGLWRVLERGPGPPAPRGN